MVIQQLHGFNQSYQQVHHDNLELHRQEAQLRASNARLREALISARYFISSHDVGGLCRHEVTSELHLIDAVLQEAHGAS